MAEKIGISVTHMSHIETGNTKLSLPVLVDISNVLEVSTDELLCKTPPEQDLSLYELAGILDNCTTQQLRIITDIIRSTKIALEKHAE